MYTVLSRVVVVVLRQYRCKINHNRIFLPPRYPPIGNYAPASLTTYVCWIFIFFSCLFFAIELTNMLKNINPFSRV